MSFSTNRTSTKVNLNAVPSTRRHLYFYLLLFLGTAVGHNLWQGCQSSTARPEAVQAHELVSQVQNYKP
jgi:hypothetical protein